MKKHFKKIGVAFSVVFLILLLLPQEANACIGVLGAPTFTECLISLFQIVLNFFNFVFGLFFSLGVWLVDLMMNFNLNIMNNNHLVDAGWSIARDIANLGFVLVIVIVAIATILRFQTYGAKALLPKLIGAAILVNFSLTIAGAFIGFSNVLTNFFMDKVGGTNNFPNVIAGAFGPQKFLLPSEDPLPPNPADEASGFTYFGAAVLISISSLTFVVLFTLLAAIVMIALAFMLFLRYLYLSFLLVLAPIIWLFWVIPALSGHFSKWWNKFFEWVFFAPAVSFFLYLSIVTIERMGATKQNFETSAQSAFGSSIMAEVMAQGMQMLVVAGIMVFGLILAQNTGIAGAQAAVGAAKGIGKGVGKWAGSKALRGGQEAIRGAARFALNPKDTYKSWRDGIKNRWNDFKTRPFKVKERLEKAKEKTKEGLGKLATMKPIETPSLASSLFNEVGKATGLWSPKEKKPAKTIADLEKELEGKEKQKDALMRLHLDTTEIDQDIRDIESKIQSIKDAKLRADLVLMDKDEFERNLQEAEKKLKDLENERETGGAEARTPAKEREYRAARREYELMKKEEKFRKERGGATK